MKAKLILRADDGSARELDLPTLPADIGRSPTAGIRLGDRWLSRHHCRLEETAGVLLVRDLGSRHGTFVNGARILECELRPGDHLRIGLTEFVAVYEEWPAAVQ